MNFDYSNTAQVAEFAMSLYEGRHSFLVILIDLYNQYDQSGDCQEFERQLEISDRVSSRLHELYKTIWGTRDYITGSSVAGSSEERVDQHQFQYVAEALSACKPELYNLANSTIELVSDYQVLRQPVNVAKLIASYGWLAYTRAYYVKLLVAVGSRAARAGIPENYSILSESAQRDIYLVDEMARQFKINKILFLPDLNELVSRARAIPGLARVYAHEINQILSSAKGEMSYSDCDFPKHHAQEWRLAGIPARIAGYWEAYNVSADEYKLWTADNVFSPAEAFALKACGYVPGISR